MRWCAVIGAAEYGAPRHEDIRPGTGYAADVVRLDPAVHLQFRLQAALVQHAAQGGDLGETGLYEGLAAKARIDGHDQHEVHQIEHRVDMVDRRARIERDAGLLPEDDLMCCKVRCRCWVASASTTMLSAPALANSGMYQSGSIIRWTSNGRAVAF